MVFSNLPVHVDVDSVRVGAVVMTGLGIGVVVIGVVRVAAVAAVEGH